MRVFQKLYHKVFVGSRTSGVYPDVAAARRAIPADRKVGYDHEEAANLYPWLAEHTKISDFAVLFHFAQIVRPGMRIFDFGGNIGVLYYAYGRRWKLPPDVQWIVCDVPAVVEAGRAHAALHPSPGLSFTTNFEDAAGTDVLLTSGTLQCVEDDFARMLSRLGDRKPPHLFVNRMPLWDRPAFVTLQDLGPVIYPYQVFNRAAFLTSMSAQGYSVLDQWECPEKVLSIRFRPQLRIRSFDGYYFGLPGVMLSTTEGRVIAPEGR